MTDLDRLQDDFGFVRASISGSPIGAPPSVYFLWSALVFCGFTLTDVQTSWIPGYWMVAGPLGGMLSGYLGYRDQRILGQLDCARGARYALHWGAVLCVILLGVLMVKGGRIASDAFGPLVLLFLAQAYFHAGVHLDKPLRWTGLLMAVGYIVVLTVTSYAWTMVGVMLAAAMVFTGLRESRARVIAA